MEKDGRAEKIYYRIGEVSRLTGLAAHTIRYWEREFTFLKPRRDGRGRRLYTPADLAKINRLKELIRDRGYRLAAARRLLRRKPGAEGAAEPPGPGRRALGRNLARIARLLERIAEL
jgi:DNA-binding transcriptional MerR regulator